MRKNEDLATVGARLPKALIRKLDKAAKSGGRTRSSEVKLRLERSLKELPLLVPAA